MKMKFLRCAKERLADCLIPSLLGCMTLLGSCDSMNNFDSIKKVEVEKVLLSPLQREMKFRNSFESDFFITEWTVPAQKTVILPLDSNYNYNFLVDWGDDSNLGQVTAYNHPEARHTYSTSGTYRVRIAGTLPALVWNAESIACRDYLTRIIQWGNTGFVTFRAAFQYCSSLNFIPSSMPDVETYSFAFQGCTSLTSLPVGLFDNCNRGKYFASVFAGCVNLKSIPEGLFSDCISATSFAGVFSQTGILFIPADLFKNCYQVSSFGAAFLGCKSITSIPENLFYDCTQVTSFSLCFASCSGLKSIPLQLFDHCKMAASFSNLFKGCRNLQGLTPATNGYRLWERAGLAGFPVRISGMGCFNGCTNLSDYDEIPADWK